MTELALMRLMWGLCGFFFLPLCPPTPSCPHYAQPRLTHGWLVFIYSRDVACTSLNSQYVGQPQTTKSNSSEAHIQAQVFLCSCVYVCGQVHMCVWLYMCFLYRCICKHMCVWLHMYMCACVCAGQRKSQVVFFWETSTLNFEAVFH